MARGRPGPYLEWQLGRRRAMNLAGGLAFAVVDGYASWSETLTVNGVSDPTHSGSGTGIGNIDAQGNVHPDQFWQSLTLGNVKEWPFSEIWRDTSNETLSVLRNRADREIKPVIECVKSFSSRWRHATSYEPALVLPPLPDWSRMRRSSPVGEGRGEGEGRAQSRPVVKKRI